MAHLQTAVLALVGLAIVALGINAGFGGIRTLGWQVDPAFVTVADPAAFAAQDSHARFIGAVWLGVGLLFLAGSLWRDRLRDTLIALCAVIALAGLIRIAAPVPPSVYGSLAFELIGFPLIAFWLHKTRP